GIQQVRILGRLQRRGGPGPVLLVAAAQIGQDLLEAGGIALFHQLLVPAAGADLVTGGDEQLHRRVGTDHRPDVAAVQHGAPFAPRGMGGEPALVVQQGGPHFGQGSHLRGGKAHGLRAQVAGGKVAFGQAGGGRSRVAALAQHLAADRAVERAGIEIGIVVPGGELPRQGALAGGHRAIDGDHDRGCCHAGGLADWPDLGKFPSRGLPRLLICSARSGRLPLWAMEWAWIPITIWAAFCQTIRTGLQKQLKGRLSTNGASFTRFVYGLPLAVAYLLATLWATGRALPEGHAEFYAWTALGAVAQILATNLLILALTMRNFVVATAYSKTEALQAAAFGMLILAEPVSLGGIAAIMIGTVGVLLISLKGSDNALHAFLFGWMEKSALIGIGSGALFAVSAIGFRAASLSLGEDFLPLAAATTLVHAILLQIV